EVSLDADHNRLHARLVVAMDLFIVSHEEAHVILGHVSKDAVPFSFQGAAPLDAGQCAAAPADTAIILMNRTRKQEFEADTLGYQLMVKARGNGGSNHVDLMVGAAAPHVVFRIIDAADAYSRATKGRSF